MKKGVKWVIIGVIGLGALGAVFGAGKDKDKEDSKAVALTTASSVTNTTTETGQAKTEASTETVKTKTVSISEQVLIDQDGIKITATGLEHDDIWGDKINILVENNSAGTVWVGLDAFIINGFMIDDLFACNVAAGKKSNESISLSEEGLKNAGITTVGEIELYFYAHDEAYDDIFRNLKAEIKTSGYDSRDTADYSSMDLVYSDDDLEIRAIRVTYDTIWGAEILMYIKNKSDKIMQLNVEDMSVNGFMVTPASYQTVYGERAAVEDITLMPSDLEENNITEVKECEFCYRIHEKDVYGESITTDPIKLSFQ